MTTTGKTDLSYTGQIQYFTANQDGTYEFTVDGAQGGMGAPATSGTSASNGFPGGGAGGNGAVVTGDLFLQAGAKLEIIVGGKGGDASSFAGGGGGGGSYVFAFDTKTGAYDILEFIAGGGGGGGNTVGADGGGGRTETTGGNGGGSGEGVGGRDGRAGAGGATRGGGGGGYTGGDGAGSQTMGGGGATAAQTFGGGSGFAGVAGRGGFGGGGGGGSSGGGGGGGYGGGGGGGSFGVGGSGHGGVSGGGGGGSYVDPNATGVTRTAATHMGDGLITIAPVCFCTGTRILTARGEVAVEDLEVGDLAVTASGRHRLVRWIGRQEVDCRAHPRPQEVMPVRVAAGAFGPGRPARDLWVSPGHALALDLMGEVLVPASALVNGATVAQVDAERVTYWHVELDAHDVLVADGTPAESYIDTGNRAFFGTGEGAPDPERTPATLADYCRPFHDGGAFVAVARTQLRHRAMALGWRVLPPGLDGLHLVADGRRIEPAVSGLTASFALPASACEVWLCSGAGAPRDVDPRPDGDARRLGLLVGELAVAGGGLLAAGDARLDGAGWHPSEGDRRWTSGRARVPAALWAGLPGAVALTVVLRGYCVPRWAAPEGLAPSAGPRTAGAPAGLRLVHAA